MAFERESGLIFNSIYWLTAPRPSELGMVEGMMDDVSVSLSAEAGQIFLSPSSIEHLHEDRLLEPFDRLKRLDLLREEAIIDQVARTALHRIVLNESLWPHFANRKGLEAFWAFAPDVRRAIWGDPVNPLDALTEFDPKYIQDGDLGA
jgi:hypothetical protein